MIIKILFQINEWLYFKFSYATYIINLIRSNVSHNSNDSSHKIKWLFLRGSKMTIPQRKENCLCQYKMMRNKILSILKY